MLQNASLLAIVAVHTAENEPSKVGDASMMGGAPRAESGLGRRARRAPPGARGRGPDRAPGMLNMVFERPYQSYLIRSE